MAAKPKKTRTKTTKDAAENRMANLLDDVLEFEKFKDEVAPKLREMLASGASSSEILEFAEAHAAARMATTAILSRDDKTAVAASKDILDRTRGRATEKKKVEHKFENLPDQELDAVLAGKLSKLSDDEEELH